MMTISVANPCEPLGRDVYIVLRAQSADGNRAGNSNEQQVDSNESMFFYETTDLSSIFFQARIS